MMESDFWIRLPLAVLWIFGVYACFEKDMIFGKLGDWLWKNLPQWVSKPLFSCAICMASVHGTAIWLLTDGDVYRWPIFCIVLCGTNRLLSVNLND